MIQKALKLKKALNLVKLKFLPFSASLSKFCKFSFYESIKNDCFVKSNADGARRKCPWGAK